MKEIALTLPGASGGITINPSPGPSITDLGGLVSGLLNIGFFIAGFLMVAWMFWGVFQYIFAGGNKDGLAKARSRMMYAAIGFTLVAASFLISDYVRNNTLKRITVPVQNVSIPSPSPNP